MRVYTCTMITHRETYKWQSVFLLSLTKHRAWAQMTNCCSTCLPLSEQSTYRDKCTSNLLASTADYLLWKLPKICPETLYIPLLRRLLIYLWMHYTAGSKHILIETICANKKINALQPMGELQLWSGMWLASGITVSKISQWHCCCPNKRVGILYLGKGLICSLTVL